MIKALIRGLPLILWYELTSLLSFLSVALMLVGLFVMECILWVFENAIAYLEHLRNKV